MTFEELYADFAAALRRSRLRIVPFDHVQVDLRSLDRTARFDLDPPQLSERPALHVAGHLSFRWDTLDTARGRTSEVDVLTQLLGPRTRLPRTEKRWLRLDIELRGTTEWGRPLPDPGTAAWRAFRVELDGRLAAAPLVQDDDGNAGADGFRIRAWQGEPRATHTCGPDGTLRLDAVRLEAWQALDIPRRFDADRRPEPGPDLDGTLARVATGIAAWTGALRHLLPRTPRAEDS